MLDVEGLQLTSAEAKVLERQPVGGVILFARNYADPEQLKTLTQAIHEVRPELLIAIDQEGGRVQRCREGFTRIPAMGRIGHLYENSPEQALLLARDCGWLLASELIAHGVDISFAPVLDLNREISQVIGDRSFGIDVDQVITLAKALMNGMHEAGMATTGKHFPGHGAVSADSHLTVPVDERSFEQISSQDLQPFAQLIDATSEKIQGFDKVLDALMPAHVIYNQCDDLPAGFSTFWLQQVLRQQLGFTGMIFSDDLSMEGAGVAGSYPERAQAAIEAGCDMVLVCNHPDAARDVLVWMETQQLPSVPGVVAMKAKKTVDIDTLRTDPRWLRTKQQLDLLTQ
ncbi:beta-N-acetylhexosaminidase [Motiliproteus sp. MSK22-1]|nr:beta-N-acetylhexosaminidase [Motiliproteus sp. MSK22-1]